MCSGRNRHARRRNAGYGANCPVFTVQSATWRARRSCSRARRLLGVCARFAPTQHCTSRVQATLRALLHEHVVEKAPARKGRGCEHLERALAFFARSRRRGVTRDATGCGRAADARLRDARYPGAAPSGARRSRPCALGSRVFHRRLARRVVFVKMSLTGPRARRSWAAPGALIHCAGNLDSFDYLEGGTIIAERYRIVSPLASGASAPSTWPSSSRRTGPSR